MYIYMFLMYIYSTYAVLSRVGVFAGCALHKSPLQEVTHLAYIALYGPVCVFQCIPVYSDECVHVSVHFLLFAHDCASL